MPAPKKPQDRKPAKGALFSFVGADGKSYTLPLASDGATAVSGHVMRDALMGGNTGELKLGFVLLDKCGASQAVIDAVLDLPSVDCMTVLAEWMSHGDGKGASVPQSSGSST